MNGDLIKLEDERIKSELQRQFDEDDIQWRVQQAGISKAEKPYVMVVPYVNNRAIQKRLDDVFGIFGWGNKHRETKDSKGYICEITAYNQGREITKSDGAEYTNIEPLKGALSDSMKRTAVQFGIGRYLYQLDVSFAVCAVVTNRRDADKLYTHYKDKRNKKDPVLISWTPPKLPAMALPNFDIEPYIDRMKSASTHAELAKSYRKAELAAKIQNDGKVLERLVDIGKSRRQELKEKALLRIADDTEELNNWYKKQIAALPLIKTTQSVSLVIKAMQKEIKIKAKETAVDVESMLIELDAAHKSRIAELEESEKTNEGKL